MSTGSDLLNLCSWTLSFLISKMGCRMVLRVNYDTEKELSVDSGTWQMHSIRGITMVDETQALVRGGGD